MYSIQQTHSSHAQSSKLTGPHHLVSLEKYALYPIVFMVATAKFCTFKLIFGACYCMANKNQLLEIEKKINFA